MKEYDFSNPTLKKSKLFLSSRKNSNELVGILSNLEDVSKIEPAHILSIQYIFEELNKNNQLSLEDLSEGEAEYKYRQWLLGCYENSFLKLLNCLSKSDNTDIQQQTLTTLLIFTEIDKNLFENVKLINNKLTDIINVVIKRQGNITNLINILKEHVLTVQNGVTDDMWKCLASATLKEIQPQEHLIVNVISIVDSFPKSKTVQTKEVESTKKGNKKKVDDNRKAVTVAVNKVWEWCLRHHTSKSLKNLLITLLEHFLPLLSNPTFLTDFLIGTLNKGGATSLLALQGIYTLILKYNIDYPNIYGKLYTMVKPVIFTMKYKARFFYLLDLFLTSTHLPENMVASFIKRLARLALKSRPHDILILLPFIGNLLIRHPSLKKLLNHPGGDIQIDNDPFSMEESDPSRTGALESSLWEVKALQHHVLPSVSRAAMFINEPLPSVEWDLSDKLETTSDQIFDKERKKKMKTTSTTFERPSSLSLPRGFEFSKIWLL